MSQLYWVLPLLLKSELETLQSDILLKYTGCIKKVDIYRHFRVPLIIPQYIYKQPQMKITPILLGSTLWSAGVKNADKKLSFLKIFFTITSRLTEELNIHKIFSIQWNKNPYQDFILFFYMKKLNKIKKKLIFHDFKISILQRTFVWKKKYF